MGQPTHPADKSVPTAGFQISFQPLIEAEELDHPGKFATTQAPSGHQPGSEPGDLPRSYGENWIYLTAQDPHRLFTYWDLDIASHPGGPAIIRCYLAETGELELEFEVPFEARNWYIPVNKAGTAYRVEIGHYRAGKWVSLGSSQIAVTPSDKLSPDTSFRFATLPLDTAFGALLASLPPAIRHHPDLMRHLAALQQRQGVAPRQPSREANEEALRLLKQLLGDALLLELLSGSWSSAALSAAIYARLLETLNSESASALLLRFQEAAAESSLFSGLVQFERLSSETLSSAELAKSALSSWTESLLSWSLAARHAAASEWLTSWGMVPGRLESSAAAASWFEVFAASWGAAIGAAQTGSWSAAAKAFGLESLSSEQLASWLFAAFGAAAVSSEQLASWLAAAAERAGISSETLTSWLAAAAETRGLSSEQLSSWLFASGISSETLASWYQAGAFSSETLASWASAAALSSQQLASWLTGLGLSSEQLASWARSAQAALSSWSQAALSSWFTHALSSWSAESLSSWTREVLSSWSAAETGSWHAAPGNERGFFMHVNAELIFYGGTDPKATVTIASQPVTLRPDGTFHYHFIFPDGTYEIPVIATSPDGREQRKAILRFERRTATEGKVDATSQPPLSVPLGKIG